MDTVHVPAKFEVRSFTRSWDNSDCSFGVVLQIPNLGEVEAVGVGYGTVQKNVGEFLYRLSIVTFLYLYHQMCLSRSGFDYECRAFRLDWSDIWL